MSSCFCATVDLKDPVPLVEKSRASCPGGRPQMPTGRKPSTHSLISPGAFTSREDLSRRGSANSHA